MRSLRYSLLSVVGTLLGASGQCVTSGYVPCLAPGTQVAVAPPLFDPYVAGGSGFFSSIQGAAADGVQVRDATLVSSSPYVGVELDKRQNSLCCRPKPVECLYAGDVPFCYTPSTTRVFFSDGSYGFLSNDTFYGSDGTFIDYQNGIYEYPNGTEVHFATDADSSSSSSSVGASSTSTLKSSVTSTISTSTSTSASLSTTASYTGASPTSTSGARERKIATGLSSAVVKCAVGAGAALLLF